MGEVMQLIETVGSHMSIEFSTSIQQCAEEAGIDASSDFFQKLPEMFDKLASPLASVRTVWRKKSFILKKLSCGKYII